jgi:tripartite-type tricarboxylate transporter receptor subunit TctC
MVLFVRRDLPADTFKELVELARTRNLNYASQGYGIPGHLLGEILRTSTNTRLTHVPYKGSAPAMNDLLGGQVDLLFDGLPAGLQHLASGKLKALAITSPRRSSLLPDIPTTTELGVPELNMNVWFGVVTHAAAPSAVAHESNRTFTETLKVKKVAQLFESQGFELTPMTSNAFSGLIKTESDRWHAVLEAHQIKID